MEKCAALEESVPTPRPQGFGLCAQVLTDLPDYNRTQMNANCGSEGLLSERLLHEARWVGKDKYPATPEFRLELDELLRFLAGHNRLNSFWPRLIAPRPQERDDALQEIRVARFLTTNGFPIAGWEPAGNGNHLGEFSVEVLASPPVFIEVKSPGWEGQLSKEQRDAGRARHEKYQNDQGGADDPWRAIRMSVQKHIRSFRSGSRTCW